MWRFTNCGIRWGPVKLEIQINSGHLCVFFSKAQACSSISILSAPWFYFCDCAEEEMRMSCNGCRVLRRGCSENCSIRPCLQWIKSHDSQANATVFLAKFYGRAGLMNLINAGPDHLRPAIFRSLLYEACGRIVNPIYGSVGLLWSGSWQLCQAAVEAVLKGAPIIPITSEAAANGHGPPLKPYDIRHVAKDENSMASDRLRQVKTRSRRNRSVGKPKSSKNSPIDSVVNPAGAVLSDAMNRSTSHESSLSHQSEAPNIENESKESESIVSMETGEASGPVMIRSETESFQKRRYEVTEEGDIALELTLGLKPPPVSRAEQVVPVKKRKVDSNSTSHVGACKTELGLEFPA